MADVRDLEPSTNPLSDPSAPSSHAPLAIDSHGRFIMNLAVLPNRNLTGREMYTGVYLTPEEAELAKAGIDNTAEELAGRIGGKIPKR